MILKPFKKKIIIKFNSGNNLAVIAVRGGDRYLLQGAYRGGVLPMELRGVLNDIENKEGGVKWQWADPPPKKNKYSQMRKNTFESLTNYLEDENLNDKKSGAWWVGYSKAALEDIIQITEMNDVDPEVRFSQIKKTAAEALEQIKKVDTRNEFNI